MPLFGHGAAVACHNGAGWICIDPLELSASLHDVKIALLGTVHTRPRHRPVAVRIHGIGAIKDGVDICSINSPDRILVKGAGRGRERDETDPTDRGEVIGVIAEDEAVGRSSKLKFPDTSLTLNEPSRALAEKAGARPIMEVDVNTSSKS